MSLQDDLLSLVRIKDEMAALNEEKDVLEARMILKMGKAGQKTCSVTIDGASVKGTVIAPQRVSIDEQKVKDRVDVKMWRKITRLVLDKEKLEAAVALGEIDANLVAECSDIKDTKPYVKVSGDQKVIAQMPVETTKAKVAKQRITGTGISAGVPRL